MNITKEKTIEELVTEKPSLAAAFNFLGIHFENYNEHTLSEICAQKGLNKSIIEIRIEEILGASNNAMDLDILPLDLLVEYLKHNHYIFIKQRLPFITQIIKNFDGDFPEIKNELKLVFPLFVQDFVEHIYEEEDTLFNYISILNEVNIDSIKLNGVQAKMLGNSISRFQNDHEVHDDPFKGLRGLTENFEIDPKYDLKTRIALTELKSLDAEMQYHAKVENEILFPKALALERKVLALIGSANAMN
ncbi:MAG: iron-sulfur cluster repair di-iron protein [Cytophagales bacterium]